MMIGLGELDESDKGVRPIRRTDWSLVQRDERVARADARCMRCGTGRDGRTGGRQATEVQEAARARVPRGRRTVGLGLVGRALRCKQSVSRGMMWQCERVSWRMRCWINKYMERTTYTASSWGAADRLHRETQGTRREMWHTKGNSVHENNPEQSTHTGTDPTAIQCAAGRPAEVGYDVDRSTATWDIPCIFMQQAPKLQASGRMEIFILQFCRPRLLTLGTNAMNGRK
ncbi:hypothetical protein HDK64DRAFT_141927 [Phyllosticta capitalensis]